MKSLKFIATGILAASFVTTAAAADVEGLLKANECTKCHTLTTKKKGPAYKTSAAEWKAAKVSPTAAVAKMKEGHDELKGSDAELKQIAEWILSL